MDGLLGDGRVDAPSFDDLAGLGEADEQVLVEALAQPAVEGLDETILRRLTGAMGCVGYTAAVDIATVTALAM